LQEKILVHATALEDENAMVIELTKRRRRIEQQKRFQVLYEGQEVGTLIPDLIVDEAVIVDPKVVTAFTETHIAQMIGYLAITGLSLAICSISKRRTGAVDGPAEGS